MSADFVRPAGLSQASPPALCSRFDTGERANCVNNRTVSDKMVAGIHEASIPLGCHPEIAPSFFCLRRSGCFRPNRIWPACRHSLKG